MSVTKELFEPMLATGAPRPLITHYDDAVGARVELSRATVANWAAKTANWLVDELDLEPGTPVAVSLPAHWQTAGVLLGAWWCGAHVTNDPKGAEVAFVPASDLAAGQGAYTVAALGLDPMGAAVPGLPDGVIDFVSDVRVFGDDFTARMPVPGDTPALLTDTVDTVVASARERAKDFGGSPRVLSTMDWTLPSGVLDGFLAVLAAQGSLVQCTHPDLAKLDQRRADERTTADLGPR